MHLILYVVLIVIMSYFIMYFVSDDKNKVDQCFTRSILAKCDGMFKAGHKLRVS